MEPFRLKLKVGPHEFEAEGDQEMVERQLSVWRELIEWTWPANLVTPTPDRQVSTMLWFAERFPRQGRVAPGRSSGLAFTAGGASSP